MTTYANGTAGRLRRLALGMTLTAAIGTALTACSAAGGTVTSHASASLPAAAASAAATPAGSTPAPPPAAASSGLSSGKWLGQYAGSYQGTFTLRWRQSGSKLTGTIDISSPAASMPIHGSVTGGKISFGTVGQYGITYSGTVSGNSMSGSYQVRDGRGSTGNWSAARS